jgi:hypothetical protein
MRETEYFRSQNVYVDHVSQIAEWLPVFGKAFIMTQPTFKFYGLFSDILVVLFVLLCAEFLSYCTRRGAYAVEADASRS